MTDPVSLDPFQDIVNVGWSTGKDQFMIIVFQYVDGNAPTLDGIDLIPNPSISILSKTYDMLINQFYDPPTIPPLVDLPPGDLEGLRKQKRFAWNYPPYEVHAEVNLGGVAQIVDTAIWTDFYGGETTDCVTQEEAEILLGEPAIFNGVPSGFTIWIKRVCTTIPDPLGSPVIINQRSRRTVFIFPIDALVKKMQDDGISGDVLNFQIAIGGRQVSSVNNWDITVSTYLNLPDLELDSTNTPIGGLDAVSHVTFSEPNELNHLTITANVHLNVDTLIVTGEQSTGGGGEG